MAAGYLERSAEPAALSDFVDKKDVFAVHLTGLVKPLLERNTMSHILWMISCKHRCKSHCDVTLA